MLGTYFRLFIVEVVLSIQGLVYFSLQAERDLMVLDIKVKLQVSLQELHDKFSFNSPVSCLRSSGFLFFYFCKFTATTHLCLYMKQI